MANTRLRQELVEGMKALEAIGVIPGATMREIERDLLAPPPQYKAREIRTLRTRVDVSQAVFAALLGVSVSTFQKWEQGTKKPNASARRLLQIVEERGLGVLLPSS